VVISGKVTSQYKQVQGAQHKAKVRFHIAYDKRQMVKEYNEKNKM
jgi:hypothetical protein